MARKKPRLSVVQEEKTGMNSLFLDEKTKETLSRTEVARRIDNGELSGYHHFRNENKRLIIRSNPDGKTENNLD